MKNIRFLSRNFHFLVVKFSVYLNRHVFVMGLFARPLSVIGRLCSVIVALHGHSLYYYEYEILIIHFTSKYTKTNTFSSIV